MSLPKYITDEIKKGALTTVPSDSQVQTLDRGYFNYMFRLVRTGRADFETIRNKAERIADYTERNGGFAKIISSSYVSYRENKKHTYNREECIIIGITDPVAKQIEDCVENMHKHRDYVTYCEPCVLDFNLSKRYNKEYDNNGIYGYVRGYNDGYSWCGTWFDGKIERTDDVKAESQFVYKNVVSLFTNGVTDISRFIYEENQSADEIWLQYNGVSAVYKIRLIARKGDYNLYLYCLPIGE